jgi:O-antigen/teichoic acid export membrane protein
LVGLALVADDAIPLVLGEKWAPAVFPFRLLSLVGVLMIFGASLPPVMVALGRPDIIFRYNLICTFIYPIGFVLLGSRYGLVGICAAWLAIYPVMLVALVTLTRAITRIDVVDLLMSQGPALAPVGLMIAAVLLTHRSLAATAAAPSRLILSIVVGTLSYGTALWLLTGKSLLGDLKVFLRELKGR